MPLDLKGFISRIKLTGGFFHNGKDLEIANEVFERYNLQTVLQTVSDFVKDGQLKTGYAHYIGVTTILINKAPDGWIRSFTSGFTDPNTISLCVGSLKSLTKVSEVQPLPDKEHYVCDQSDFEGVSQRAYLVLSTLEALVNRIIINSKYEKTETSTSLLQVSVFCLNLIAQHNRVSLWTDTQTFERGESCLQALREYYSFTSIRDLLVMDLKQESSAIRQQDSDFISGKTSILGKLLQQWNPLLSRNTWRKHPVIAESFCWCLSHLKYPHTSYFLESVLPPALLFVDDHVLANKENGIKCLINIIENTTAEELRWFGRAEVIYEALKLQMYRTEESLLKLTHIALLLIVKVLVKKVTDVSVATKYDEVFILLLQSASHENKLTLRRIHTENIHLYIEGLGINSVKYMKKILDLIEEYLEISDPPNEEARVNVLKALTSLLKIAWPRIRSHVDVILKILIKLIHEVSTKDLLVSQDSKQEVLTRSLECLELLKAIDSVKVTTSLNAIVKLPFSSQTLSIIESLIHQ